MSRRPALAVFCALLSGVLLGPWLGWAWPLAGALLLVRTAARSVRGDWAVLGAVGLLGAGLAGGPPPSLPAGPLAIEGELVGPPLVLPGRVERELEVGGRRLRASFPTRLDVSAASWVSVVGERTPSGIRVHCLRESEGQGLAQATRRGVQRALRGRTPARGLLRAVLVGDRSGLTPELRRAFRNTGCAHLLSISGLHVGVVLVWALWLGRRWRSEWTRRAVVAVCLFSYVALVGARAPTLRAAVAAAVLTWAPGRGDPLNRLSCAGIVVVLHDPAAPRGLGFLLSFGTVAGLLLTAQRPRGLLSLLRGVLTVFAVSALMLAVSVGQLPWVNAVLGVPCVLLLGVLLPLGMLGCAGALVAPGYDAWLLAPADGVSALLVRLVETGAATEGWTWIPLPRPELAALALGLGFLAGLRRRDVQRWRGCAAVAACVLAVAFWPARAEGLELRLSPRRTALGVSDGDRLLMWGGMQAAGGRREQRWRAELGRASRVTRISREAHLLETRAGRVGVVDRSGIDLEAPLELLVITRRLSARELRRVLEASQPRVVWAPASLAPMLLARPGVVHLFSARGEVRLRLPARKAPPRYGLRK